MTVRMRVLIALPSVALLACHKGDAGDSGDKAPAAVVTARTEVVAPQNVMETVGAIGTVVSRAGHVATLSAPASAHVSRVLVTTGQTVSRGQALVELDRAPFEAALGAAQAAYNVAEQAAQRTQRLADEGIVARKDVELATADVARTRAELSTAQRDARLAVLVAPIAGVITRMTATIGASVDPALPLIEIADPSALDALLSVSPSDAGRIEPGDRATLTAGMRATGEPLGSGAVSDIAAIIDSVSRAVAVRVRISSIVRQPRIGETVFGTIVTRTRHNAIVIPSEALVPDSGGFRVFVVDSAGIAHARSVTTGANTGGGVEIVKGLVAGDRIVTYGAYGVSDSAKIQTSASEQPRAAPQTDAGSAVKSEVTKP
ncbi:MAG: efflux RND transporter periplasmic adaptor subunit [Gemmatimonadaceae bacterium]